MNLNIENKSYGGPGIYCIWSEEDERKRMYFGQTIKYSKRANAHKGMLNRKVHPNKYLQNLFNKGYIMNIAPIECCAVKELCDRETHWINFFDTTNSDKGFNLEEGGKRSGRTGISGSLKGRPQTEEHKLNKSARTKGKKRNYTPEHIAMIKAAMAKNKGTRHRGKEVKVTDLNTGIVTTFESKRAVEDFLSIERDMLIHKFYYGRPRVILKEIVYKHYKIER